MQFRILELIGAKATFLQDRVFMTHPDTGEVFYYWRAGDPCHICGPILLPGTDQVTLLVFYGDSDSESVEIPLSDLSTELATADRRQRLASLYLRSLPPEQTH